MRILIVGGGIAGLAMARALARVDLESEIVERTPGWQIAGAGVYLPGNGMAALARLGLAEQVSAVGDVIERRRLLDERGRMLIYFDEAGFWRSVGPPTGLHRRDLHRILAEGAAGTPIRLGISVASLAPANGAVQVGFDDGSAGTYDLVVGADGVHSSIRQLALGGPAAQLAGQVGWRFVIEGHPEIRGWNGWIGPDRGFLALGIGGGRVYCFGDVRSKDGRDPTNGDVAGFLRLFDGFAEPVPALLSALTPASELWFAPIEEVTPPTWSKDRVVLIGDAAHASSPNMAEGASMAMEDAVILADLLASGPDVLAALDAFVERRTPRVNWVQHMTHRRDRLRYLNPLLRRTVMRIAGTRTFRAHYGPLLAPP
jgi:2-polyprenyl-6-methoxyphenol hydroxylase-like FAD-dependent oxidoreductase